MTPGKLSMGFKVNSKNVFVSFLPWRTLALNTLKKHTVRYLKPPGWWFHVQVTKRDMQVGFLAYGPKSDSPEVIGKGRR